MKMVKYAAYKKLKMKEKVKMYMKNLKKDLRLRLSEQDMQFLTDLSTQRGCSVSEILRSIVGEYRRGLESLRALQYVMNQQQKIKESEMSNGDTTTDCNDFV
jgi:predicted transport protein